MFVTLMTIGQAVLTAVFIVGLLAFAWSSSRDARDRRRLRKIPVTTIAAAPVGAPVRLQGVVHRHVDELSSPLTGQAGVYYNVQVEGKNDGQWSGPVREAKGVDFILRDASGEALVRSQGARWVVRVDHRSKSGTLDPADAAQSAFLGRHGRSGVNYLGFNRILHYEERVLEIGSLVSVFAMKAAGPGPQVVVEAGPREFLIADEETPARATS